MIHKNRIKKSNRKLQYGGQLYDLLPEYKEGFVDYKGIDPNTLYNTTVQLQTAYDNILKEKREALKTIRDTDVHTIYSPLKTSISADLLAKNEELLKQSNNDVLNPIYSQGILDEVDSKMNSPEWIAAIDNTKQLTTYEANKAKMLEQNNVQNYDDPTLPVYNDMLKGNNIYKPFVARSIFSTPDYDNVFDKKAGEFSEEELTAFAPIQTTDENGKITYEPFDVMKIDSRIKSRAGLYQRYRTLVDNFYTTAAGASFARKVAMDMNIPPNPDGSVNMSDPAFKAEYEKQVLEMMSRAAVRNQSYKETGTIVQLQGRQQEANFQRQQQLDASYKQAQIDANRDEILQRRQAADNKESGSGSGTNADGTPKTTKAEKPNYGLLENANPDITTNVSYGFTEDNNVSFLTYRNNVTKADANYSKKLADHTVSIPSDVTVTDNDGVVTTYPKREALEKLVDYFDMYNNFDNLKINYGNTAVAGEEKNKLEAAVKDLLAERKIKQSNLETYKSLNRNAFDALKKVKKDNNPGSTESQYETSPNVNDSNWVYDRANNTIVKLDETGELFVVDVAKYRATCGDTEKSLVDIGNEVNLRESLNNNSIQKATDVATETTVDIQRLKFLESNGFYKPAGIGQYNVGATYTSKYNELTEEGKAQIDRAFLLSDEYKAANEMDTKTLEAKANNNKGIRGDVIRKLNEESKKSAAYKVTNQTIMAIPNMLTTKQTTDNTDYFSQMSQIKQMMISSPGNLSLSVYELNNENPDKGITPTYYDAIVEKSKKAMGDATNNWWYAGTKLNNPDVVFTGVARDDKLGACFYGSIVYDLTGIKDAPGKDDGDEVITMVRINEMVEKSDKRFRIQDGENGNRYLIDEQKFLVQSEVANKALFDKELTAGAESDGTAAQYKLLTEGFANNNLTVLKLDTYSSTNDIHIEKVVDKNLTTTYKVYWTDIDGGKDFNICNNLAEVAKVTYEYNLNLKKLDGAVDSNPKIVKAPGSGETNAVQNQLLIAAYNNLVRPLQYRTFKDKAPRKTYLEADKSSLYYTAVKTGNSSAINITIIPDSKNKNDANNMLLRAIREISNVENNTNGTIVNKENSIDVEDINIEIDSDGFTPLQKDLLKKYLGSDAKVVYKNKVLTISRNQ